MLPERLLLLRRELLLCLIEGVESMLAGLLSINGLTHMIGIMHYGLGVILPVFGLVSDEDAQELKYSGRAEEFNMKSSWNQNVNWEGRFSVPQH